VLVGTCRKQGPYAHVGGLSVADMHTTALLLFPSSTTWMLACVCTRAPQHVCGLVAHRRGP
jgi:hypothetical protein